MPLKNKRSFFTWNRDNQANFAKAVSKAIEAKAELDSPDFTGTPTAPTADAGTSTEQIATTEFVASALAEMGDSDTSALPTIDVVMPPAESNYIHQHIKIAEVPINSEIYPKVYRFKVICTQQDLIYPAGASEFLVNTRSGNATDSAILHFRHSLDTGGITLSLVQGQTRVNTKTGMIELYLRSQMVVSQGEIEFKIIQLTPGKNYLTPNQTATTVSQGINLTVCNFLPRESLVVQPIVGASALVQNFNNWNNAGFMYLPQNAANAPADTSDKTIIQWHCIQTYGNNTAGASQIRTQLAIPIYSDQTAGNIYTRTFYSGVWGAWQHTGSSTGANFAFSKSTFIAPTTINQFVKICDIPADRDGTFAISIAGNWVSKNMFENIAYLTIKDGEVAYQSNYYRTPSSGNSISPFTNQHEKLRYKNVDGFVSVYMACQFNDSTPTSSTNSLVISVSDPSIIIDGETVDVSPNGTINFTAEVSLNASTAVKATIPSTTPKTTFAAMGIKGGFLVIPNDSSEISKMPFVSDWYVISTGWNYFGNITNNACFVAIDLVSKNMYVFTGPIASMTSEAWRLATPPPAPDNLNTFVLKSIAGVLTWVAD